MGKASQKKYLEIVYKEIGTFEELNDIDRKLLDTALQACHKAYAPYSGLHVGAAVLLEGGLIVAGSNQENAAFPSGLCAERVAIFSASAEYPGRIIEKVLVVAKDKDGGFRPVTPCGGCRQVMLEYEYIQSHPVRVLMMNQEEVFMEFADIRSLLPMGFNRDQMPEI